MFVKYLCLAVLSATATVTAGFVPFGVEDWLDFFLVLAIVVTFLDFCLQLILGHEPGRRLSVLKTLILLPSLTALCSMDLGLTEAWQSDPEQMTQIAISFGIAYFAVHHLNFMSRSAARGCESLWESLGVWRYLRRYLPKSYLQAYDFELSMPVSPKNQRLSAVHEAGHVLVHALNPNVQNLTLTAQIVTDVSFAQTTNVLGSVRHEYRSKASGARFWRWELQLLLAGQAAEKECLGHFGNAGSDDLGKWYRCAISYLTSGFEEVTFFPDPREQWQRETNEVALARLMKSQREELGSFFSINHDLLLELSESLLEAKRMESDELMPFITRAVPINSLSMPRL